MSFWCLQYSQNTNKNNLTWGTIVVKLNFFVRFLGELKIPKRHFEINWPLASHYQIWLVLLNMYVCLCLPWFVHTISQLKPYNFSLPFGLHLTISHNIKISINNLFVTSKNETTDSPIHEFKVLHKGQKTF